MLSITLRISRYIWLIANTLHLFVMIISAATSDSPRQINFTSSIELVWVLWTFIGFEIQLAKNFTQTKPNANTRTHRLTTTTTTGIPLGFEREIPGVLFRFTSAKANIVCLSIANKYSNDFRRQKLKHKHTFCAFWFVTQEAAETSSRKSWDSRRTIKATTAVARTYKWIKSTCTIGRASHSSR